MQITLEQVRKAAHDIIVTQGNTEKIYKLHDARYCLYVHNDKPDCVVGRILFKLGVPLLVLKELDTCGNTGGSILISCAGHNLDKQGIDIEGEALAYLDSLQHYQDTGKSWGAAYNLAEEAI